MSIRNLVVTSFLAAALAVSALAQGSTSTTTTTRTFAFPPAGLGSTETAQVNVVNTASSSGTAASCTGSVSFINASGAVIGKATAFTVGSGQIASIALPFGTSGFSGTRGEFVATVTHTATIPSAAPCAMAFSLETFATATGETHVVLTNSAVDAPMGGGFGR